MRLIDADEMRNGLLWCKSQSSDYDNYWDDVIERLDAQPTVGGWISVKDRLPDKSGQYLCWFGKNIVAKGTAIATYLEMWQAFGSLESLETYPNVTHWMSLPEPPKDGDV